MKRKNTGFITLTVICIFMAAFTTSCAYTTQKAVSAPAGSITVSKERMREYREIQSAADNGHQTEKLDPEEAAAGFASKSETGDRATITFQKSGNPALQVELYQPVKKGAGGIWAVRSWTEGKTNKTLECVSES